MNLKQQLAALEAALKSISPRAFKTTLEWQKRWTPEEALGKIKATSAYFRWDVSQDSMYMRFFLAFKPRGDSRLFSGVKYIEVDSSFPVDKMDRFIMWAIDAILWDVYEQHHWDRKEIGL